MTTLAVTLALGRLLVFPVFTRANTSVSTGATGPLGPGLWKRAQTPIKEPAMATIHLHQTTTATPEQFLAGLTDFGPGRSKIFPNSADGYLKVHDQGPAQAEARNYQGQAQS